MTAPRIALFTATDTRFMPLLRGMLGSFRPFLDRSATTVVCFDLGLDDADRAWLEAQDVTVLQPRPHLGIADGQHPPALLSFLARPFMREYMPGFDVYMWVDSDVWLQEPEVAQRYVDTALAQGMAVTHENEPAYRFQAWLFGWTAKHMMLGYGPVTAAHLLRKPHVNAGFFAVAADAPHWALWADRYRAAIKRTGALVPHDQFALNHAIYGDLLARGAPAKTGLLEPGCNWICDRGVPMWNDDRQAFCRPSAPFEPIAALHLAGPAKRTAYDIKRTGGGSFKTFIVRGASPQTPILTGPLDVPDTESRVAHAAA